MTADRGHDVLAIRLDCLKRAIVGRDWAAVEWEFDRVSSAAARLAGTRGRGYDPAAPSYAAIRHVSSTDRGHGDNCYCGRPARWHVSDGSVCEHACGEHKRRAARSRNGHVTAVALRVPEETPA